MYTLITLAIVIAIVVYSIKNNKIESDPVVVVEEPIEFEPIVVEPVKKKRKPRKKKFFGLL